MEPTEKDTHKNAGNKIKRGKHREGRGTDGNVELKGM